jgi:hypothetical protein
VKLNPAVCETVTLYLMQLTHLSPLCTHRHCQGMCCTSQRRPLSWEQGLPAHPLQTKDHTQPRSSRCAYSLWCMLN